MDVAFVVSYLLLWLLLLVAVFVLLVVIRDLALIKVRLGPEPGALATSHGPKIGERIPRLRGPLFGGGEVEPGVGGPMVLLFISPHCDPCLKLLPELHSFVQASRGAAICLICQGSTPEIEALTRLFKIDVPILVDEDGRITKGVYGVEVTPFGLAVDEDWVVRSKGITNLQEHLEALVDFQITPQGERQLTPVVPAPDASSYGK